MKIHKLLIVILFLSIGCGEQTRTAYFVNVDCSNSTSREFIRESYKSDFRKVLNKADEGDVIAIDRISSNSFSTSDPLILKLPQYSIFGSNRDMFNKIIDSLKKDFANKSEKYFANPEFTQTDIINSLSRSSVYLRRNELSEFRKIIILFSDMIQETEELNLNEYPEDEKQINKLISKLEKDDKILNLDSIEVYSSGATYSALDEKKISINQTKQTKEFWVLYFEKCKMKFRDEMYQARLGDL